MSEMFIADTPEKIEHYRMAAAIAALRFETKTGMKMGRHSVLAFVKASMLSRNSPDSAVQPGVMSLG